MLRSHFSHSPSPWDCVHMGEECYEVIKKVISNNEEANICMENW